MQGGYLVAVIGADNKVSIRPIKVGPKVDTMWIVNEGLKPGDRIVAEGVQKVREGMEVHAKPFQPESSITESGHCKKLSIGSIVYKFFINRPIVSMVIRSLWSLSA